MNSVNRTYGCLSYFSVAIACSSVVVGCGVFFPQPSEKITCDVTNPKNTKPVSTTQPKVQVYVDATPSMSGYVAVPESEYIKAIRLIDRAASDLTKKPEYFAFGEKAIAFKQDQFMDSVQKSSFYEGTNDALKNTRLVNIIPEVNPNKDEKLIIAITDLYEDKGYATPVTAKLNEYIKSGYAIGIVGVKSKFKGTIYDVDGVGSEFKYPESDDAPSKIRPFYILLIGSYENVSRYVGFLQSNDPKIFDENSFSIFYTQPVQAIGQLVDLASRVLPTPSQGFAPATSKKLNQGGAIVEVSGDNIELLRTGKAPVEISYKVDFSPIPKVFNGLGLSVSIESNEVFTGKSKESKSLETRALTFGEPVAFVDKKLINLKANIDPTKLPQGVSYIKALIKIDDSKLGVNTNMQWWGAWSAEIGSRDGSKTINLSAFLGDLQSKAREGMKGKQVARLCYVFQKQ